jgi:hypothetical protein
MKENKACKYSGRFSFTAKQDMVAGVDAVSELTLP